MADPFRDTRAAAGRPDTEAAEAIAVSALGFIASDAELLQRFVAVTGIEPQQMRRAAGEPGFLAGVLQFIMAHEPTLIAFSEASAIEPQSVAAAKRALPGGAEFEQ